MSNYFRITVYHPVHNISAIMDSNGKFEKLWQFSAYLVAKGFKVIEANMEGKFHVDDMPKIEFSKNEIILRACALGPTDIKKNIVTINGKRYSVCR